MNPALSERHLSTVRGDLRGIDDNGRYVLARLEDIAIKRRELDAEARDWVDRGLELDVPVTWMSKALGLAATTLGMRMKAGRR
jgi:hypothetical protein